MSDYGLRIFNSGGKYQIDGVYPNYTLRDSANSQSIGASAGLVSHSLTTSTSYPPVILFKPLQNIGIALTSLTYASSKYSGFYIGGAANGTYSYRAFYPGGSKSSEDYGLRVYNTDATLVFDSGQAPFKIIKVIAATMGTTYSHTATDSKVFYILSPLQFQKVCTWPGPPMPPTPIQGYNSGVFRVSSTQVKVDFVYNGAMGVAQCIGSTNTGTTSNLIVCEVNE